MKVRDLAKWNPWWKGIGESCEHFRRRYNYSFLSFRSFQAKENVIIRGPRQVGKTETMIRSIPNFVKAGIPPENITYISCDRLGGLNELRNTVRELDSVMKFQEGEKVLLLDEITSIKNWELAMKEFCEATSFKVLATGSRPKELEKKAEYFPGRAEIINFYPLSFHEFCSFFFHSMLKGSISLPGCKIERKEKWEKLVRFAEKLGISLTLASKLLDELRAIKVGLSNLKEAVNLYKYFEVFDSLFQIYLKSGGYPAAIEAVINGSELPTNLIVKDTLGTVEKEGLSLDTLNLILPELLETMGSRVEYMSIARKVDTDASTVMRYINTLERSFMLREIYYFDTRVHSKKGKKIFFSDPFIANALANYYGRDVDETHVVEGIVVEHVARFIEDPFRRLWKQNMGYGIIRGKEVDVIVRVSKSKLLKIEVKYGKLEERKDVDIILSKDELSISQKPFKIPVPLYLLILDSSKL